MKLTYRETDKSSTIPSTIVKIIPAATMLGQGTVKDTEEFKDRQLEWPFDYLKKQIAKSSEPARKGSECEED